ncbi:hypothetical protein CEXT_234391 [Caerostris extrusa]|uniref:Uncharacterized protein n=1 Tax=Caerostris extrusa TaxID=172846 RepID=A0AAV4YEB7_CAEEX|nr:hypothetical protein CEXT_234391 [Caerostris extrusa]
MLSAAVNQGLLGTEAISSNEMIWAIKSDLLSYEGAWKNWRLSPVIQDWESVDHLGSDFCLAFTPPLFNGIRSCWRPKSNCHAQPLSLPIYSTVVSGAIKLILRRFLNINGWFIAQKIPLGWKSSRARKPKLNWHPSGDLPN